jgi:hypothetical protein
MSFHVTSIHILNIGIGIKFRIKNQSQNYEIIQSSYRTLMIRRGKPALILFPLFNIYLLAKKRRLVYDIMICFEQYSSMEFEREKRKKKYTARK